MQILRPHTHTVPYGIRSPARIDRSGSSREHVVRVLRGGRDQSDKQCLWRARKHESVMIKGVIYALALVVVRI